MGVEEEVVGNVVEGPESPKPSPKPKFEMVDGQVREAGPGKR